MSDRLVSVGDDYKLSSSIKISKDSLPNLTQRVLPLSDIACYGESTTESVGTNWPVTYLAKYVGATVVNKGISGQGAADVLLRMGAIEPRITLVGNKIPASGEVSVSNIDPAAGWRINGTGSFAATGFIEGIEGSLSHNMSTNAWTFTRAASGKETVVPEGTKFIRKESLAHPYHRIILGTLRNNVTTDIELAADLVTLAPNALKTEVKKLLIWGCINGTNEPKGHERYQKIIKANQRLAQVFGESFYDIRRDFIDTGLKRAGITPTAQDLTNIQNDCPPPSLMADVIHPNAAGYNVIAKLLAERLLYLGWVSSITIPNDSTPTTDPVKEPTILTSDSFNRANGALGSTDVSKGGTTIPWAAEASTSITDNQLVISGQSVNRASKVVLPTASHHVQAKLVNASEARGGGLVAGMVDTSNYYRVDNAATGIAIYKVIGGTSSPIFGPGPIAADNDVLGIRVTDTKVEATLNGSVVGAATEGRVLKGGMTAGIRSAWNTTTKFDDFVVSDI